MEAITSNSPLHNKISLFEKHYSRRPIKNISVLELINNFKSDANKKEILHIRKLVADGENDKKIKDLKGDLNCISLSVVMKTRNTEVLDSEKIISHSGFIQIDIDPQHNTRNTFEPEAYKKQFAKDPHFVFIANSPSGTGLKGGFYVPELAQCKDISKMVELHKSAYKQIEEYFVSKYNIVIDHSINDLKKVFYITYDPELILNENFQHFKVNFDTRPTEPKPEPSPTKKPNNYKTVSAGAGEREKIIIENVLRTATGILNKSEKGNRHHSRLKAGELIGGIVAQGLITTEEALNRIEEAVMNNTSLPKKEALKTVKDAIKNGTKKPLNLEKELERINQHLSKDTPVLYNEETGEIVSYVFWEEVQATKEKTKLNIIRTELYRMFEEWGLCILKLENNEEKLIFSNNNRAIELKSFSDIREKTRKYIDTLPEKISNNFSRAELKEFFSKGQESYISILNLQYYGGRISIEDFVNDTPETSYIFFSNCFLEISKEGILVKDYKDLKGLIWESQVIRHNFTKIEDPKLISNFEFFQFTKNVVTDRASGTFDQKRHLTLLNIIGYLLHNYSDDRSPAIVFTEANMTSEPKGRAGKGLIIKAIEQIRKVTRQDGKGWNFEDKFRYQSIDLDTKIFAIEDVQKSFDFSNLFSAITDGMTIEKKNSQSFHIPYEKSPKIVISTNYAIYGNSDSYKARKRDMELIPYYSSDYTPYNDFPEGFFKSWNADKWNLFYNFMVMCLKTHLANKRVIPEYSSDTMEYRQLLHLTNEDFIEYAKDHLKQNEYIPIPEFYEAYIKETGENPKTMTKQRLTKFIKAYCSTYKLNYKSELHKFGDTNARCHFIWK